MLLFVSQLFGYKGTYDASTSYKKGNIVLDQGASFICIQDSSGIPTSNTSYWAFLGSESFLIDDINLSSTTTTLSASKLVSLLSQKANATHLHSIVDINNLQPILDGKALTNHSHTLSSLTDVNVEDTLPVNDNVLTFENNKWVPKAPSYGGASITLENWNVGAGEIVELFDDIPPADVSGVNITYLDKTNLVLNWTESLSSDTKEYNIYNGATLVTTVPATASKLQPLMYQVTGLIPATNYTFSIKARDYSNNEAIGVGISVRTYGTYTILMNGTTDFIKLPSLTFDTVELTCQANPGPAGVWYTYVDARPGVSTSFFSINDNGNIQYGPVWTKILINEVSPIDINYVKNNKITLTLGLFSTATDEINIYSDYQNNSKMQGKIYSIKILNRGNVVAFYNLTEKFTGTAIVDASGNGKTATLTGGTWAAG